MNQTGQKRDFLEFITPIGRLMYVFIDTPQVEQGDGGQPKRDEEGDPIANYKTMLMWPKAELNTTLIAFRTLAAQARDLKWPPGSYDPAWFRLEPFLRDGDNPEHNTKAKEELKGHVYMTFKSKAKKSKDASGKLAYTGRPGIIGPHNEDLMLTDVYSGCYGRVSGIVFGSEYSGKKFISVRLNNIQKGGGPNGDGNGESLGGGRPDARSQFDPLLSGPVPDVLGAPGGVLPSIL